jgi:hypothetical protein
LNGGVDFGDQVITGCTLEAPQVGNYNPNRPEMEAIDIAPQSLIEAEKSAANWAITKGSVKTYIADGGREYTLTQSIGGFGPGAEIRGKAELVNYRDPHGKIVYRCCDLITPVGNGVLTIGGNVSAPMAVLLSYWKIIYQAAVANL